MSSSTVCHDGATEALEWVGRQLRYETLLADLRARADRAGGVTTLTGRAGRADTRHHRDTADGRDTAAA